MATVKRPPIELNGTARASRAGTATDERPPATSTTVVEVAGAAAPADARHRAPTAVRFSVFIPVWNDTRWLPGAIESVRAQDHDDWELIVGDNASTEDVAGVVSSFSDPRIRHVRFETHVPIDENFNRTALHARHEWVHFLGADDRLRPGCLSTLAAAIRSASRDGRRLALAAGACVRVTPDGRPADRIWYGSKRPIPADPGVYEPARWFALVTSEGQPPWNPGSLALARYVIEESGGFFRPEVGLSCDVEMVLRAGAYGDVVYVDEPVLDFVVRTDADNAVRLWANRARGTAATPAGAAFAAALRVHEHRRAVSPAERRRVRTAIARTHLQRAGQHRILPDGLGRRGAVLDVVRALAQHPGLLLDPRSLAYAAGVVAAPRRLLAALQRRLAARHPA
jgi:hypothetical protein